MAIDTVCALCSRDRACEFHGAGSLEELGRAVVRAIKKKGGIALARFITSAFATLERSIPTTIIDAIDDLEVDELATYIQRKLEAGGEMSPKQLREMAGCFLALAILADDDDDGDD